MLPTGHDTQKHLEYKQHVLGLSNISMRNQVLNHAVIWKEGSKQTERTIKVAEDSQIHSQIHSQIPNLNELPNVPDVNSMDISGIHNLNDGGGTSENIQLSRG